MQNVSENIQKFIWQYAIVFQKYATFIQQSISLLCRLYCSHFFSQLFTLASSWQLSGLVVKVLACCTGGPGFDPWMENPKFSIDIHQQRSKLDIVQKKCWICDPLYQCLCLASKRSHTWDKCELALYYHFIKFNQPLCSLEWKDRFIHNSSLVILN